MEYRAHASKEKIVKHCRVRSSVNGSLFVLRIPLRARIGRDIGQSGMWREEGAL